MNLNSPVLAKWQPILETGINGLKNETKNKKLETGRVPMNEHYQ